MNSSSRRCHSCLKELDNSLVADFCPMCAKRLFSIRGAAKKIPATLPFSLPELKKYIGQNHRISVSGAQPKFSLGINDSKLSITDQGGSFILKPAIKGTFEATNDMPANEHLTMQMARQVFKIETADCAWVKLSDGTPTYITKRFDINPDGTRRQQQDFAQVAGLTPGTNGSNYKYDFSYQQIATLMERYVSTYQVEAEKYFKLILFNYLICNGDAHVKNFSIYSINNDGIYKMTPAYDLLNTQIHVQELGRTALELFNDDFETNFFKTNAFYGAPDFLEFAKRIGINQNRAQRFILEFTDSARQTAAKKMIDKSFLSQRSKRLFKQLFTDRTKALSIE